jgi:hypothetical protein
MRAGGRGALRSGAIQPSPGDDAPGDADFGAADRPLATPTVAIGIHSFHRFIHNVWVGVHAVDNASIG